jgi:hypothetical protein
MRLSIEDCRLKISETRDRWVDDGNEDGRMKANSAGWFKRPAEIRQ